MKTAVIPEPIKLFKVQNRRSILLFQTLQFSYLAALVNFPQLSNDIKQTKMGMLYFIPNGDPLSLDLRNTFQKCLKFILPTGTT